ncbi:MAG: hypothetical protein AAF707_05695, partial [Pseudomonadota bacterium]
MLFTPTSEFNTSTGTDRSAPVSVPFQTVLFSMIVLWATYFALITLRSVVMDFELQLEMAWRRIIVTLFGIGLTVVLWFVLR